MRNFHSTRPITGYLNRGLNSLNVNLDYQCMDAGKFDDPTGLTHFNPSRPPGFLSGSGGVTLLSSWSEGVVAWSNAQYAPYRARPLLPGAKAGEFEPGTGCDPDHFKEPDFHPGWKWEKTQVNVDWAKLSSLDPDGFQPDSPSTVPRDGGFPKRATRFFADIDGDGLVDRLVGNGLQAFEFESAYVEFTGLFARNEPLPGGGRGPAQIPFTWNFDEPTSLAPGPRQWTRGDTRFYYVDINGDGLVDLVTYNPGDSGGAPRVRPGDGHGHFVCETSQQPWPCQEWPTEPSSAYEVAATGSRRPWPFNEETFFHDVTGDGLADIVQYDMASGEVRLWVNQDGHTFACVTGSCVAGKVLDQRTATFDIGDHRTTFADMNADGIDDIVILAKQGAYVGTFMKKYVAVQGFERGAAPRPGLLTRIHNGYGATTDIRYDTIQGLDQAVRETAFAWRYHSPVVENVVTQIVTQDSYHAGGNLNEPQISAPYQFKRKARYLYQNPAYDRWSRSFAGFRKVVARYGEEQATTATTYWFGPCQNNGLGARLATAPDLPLCPKGSDDEDQKSLTGRVVRIDRGNDLLSAFPLYSNIDDREPPRNEGPKLLWTRTFGYSSSVLFDRPDRRVSFSYPGQIDTYLYDDAQPTKPGGETPSPTGGDALENPAHQKGIRKHLSRQVEYDGRGTQRRVTDRGAVKDEDSRPADRADATTITLFSSHDPSGSQALSAPLPCTPDWQCLPDYISIWEPQPTRTGNDPDKLLRKSHFTYTATRDIRSVEGWLDVPAKPLERHHPAGAGGMAPEPPGQSLGRGWHTFATLSYDTWNNLIQTVGGQSPGGSPPRCTTIVYDTPYQHLPSIMRDFKDGCSGSALTTQSVFDRGFEQVVSSVSPNGGVSEIRHDHFGRPIELYLPDPGAVAGTQKPVLAATIAYSDGKPASYVDVRRMVGPGTSTRSVTLLNSLGETIVAFDQGNNNDWVLNGWRETNLAGQLTLVRRPWTSTADPIVTADKASFITVPSDNSFFEVRYDGFGRKASIKESGAGFSLESMRTSYFPLAVETRDAEQLKPGGIHAKAFRRMELDGYGRSARVIEQIKNPAADTIVSTVKYDPMGEPVTITRTHAGGTYQRTMEFDTLGRLMANREPNTGNNWHYVWDDAGRLVGTSDARGCGVNFHHDGLGRLIGEDYSPCLTAQAAYTSPNLATGEGLEAFYRYDTYEADQVSPEPNFLDDPRCAQGNLVSVSDRGSHTRFNYDARGRVRRVARQIAKPRDSGAGSPYAPHWFTSRLDYDLGDRLTRRTTGVDVQELLMNGGSEERFTYSPRGQLSSIDSSYGAIIKSMVYDPDGAPRNIRYGDVRGTTASFAYDNRRRLAQYLLVAPYDGVSTPVEHFDYRYSAYDEVGNPLIIEDRRAPWTPLPAEASPVKTRTLQYDDLYRLTRMDSTYAVPSGPAPWSSPFKAEIAKSDRHPVPLRALKTRVAQQTFDYDGLGNLTASSDDLSARYDRSLGPNLGYGTAQNGPNQLRSGDGLRARYDPAGNLSELKIQRAGDCPTGAASQCAQWFAYDWDEVGQLARARRWDFDGNTLPPQVPPDALPSGKPVWDLTYAYSQGARVSKSVADAASVARHTLEVFDTLRIEPVRFDSTRGNYEVRRFNVHAYPGGVAHVFWDSEGRLPHQVPDSFITMHLVVGDHLGSSSVVINHATGELVERTTYQPYGAVESDYRPSKWEAFREPHKFTGKEEDIEVGATYFGARYYQPHLGRFMSADPSTLHGLGGDLNPYAYVGGRVMTHIDQLGLEGACAGVAGPCQEAAETIVVGEAPVAPTQSTEVLIDETTQPGSPAGATPERQMTSFAREPSIPEHRSLADSTPILPFFLPVPSAYIRPYQAAPQGAPPGLDAMRQLNGQTGVGVANFSRDKYPGTDVRNLTLLTVSGMASTAAEVAQVGSVAAQTTRALPLAGNAAATATARGRAVILTETFGKGRAAPGPGPTSVREAQTVLRELKEGTFKPPSDLTRAHLEYYEGIANAAINGPKGDPLGVQALRLQIVEMLKVLLP